MPEEPEKCARHGYVLGPGEPQCPHCACEVLERMRGLAIDPSVAATPHDPVAPASPRQARSGDSYSSRAVPGQGGIADEKVLGCLLWWVQHYGRIGGVEALEALHGCNWNARRALEWLLGTRAQGSALRLRPVLETDVDRYEWEMGAAAYVSNQTGSAFGDALILLNTRAWDVEGTIHKLVQKRAAERRASVPPPRPARREFSPDTELVRFVRWCIWLPYAAVIRGLALSAARTTEERRWCSRYVWGGLVMMALWALVVVMVGGLLSRWTH